MAHFSTSLAMRTTIQGMKMKFPSVKTVTTATLQRWIERGKTTADSSQSSTSGDAGVPAKLIIVDARPEQEYMVSHIATSLNICFEMDDMESMKELLKQQASGDDETPHIVNVIPYCSVGYRSSVLAEKLQKATKSDPAYKNWQFFNLEGGIFKWANENRQVVDMQEQLTNHVHPFSELWGKMIDKERWKYNP